MRLSIVTVIGNFPMIWQNEYKETQSATTFSFIKKPQRQKATVLVFCKRKVKQTKCILS